MSRARKYRPGRVVQTMRALCAELDAGRYVYMGDRPCNPGWLISMQYRSLRWMLAAGRFRFAKVNA